MKFFRVMASSTSSPRVGMARQALATLTTVTPPRPLCPIRMPSGIAMTAASSSASAVYPSCSRIRTGMPSAPCHCCGCFSQFQA